MKKVLLSYPRKAERAPRQMARFALVALCSSQLFVVWGQTQKVPTLKSILLEQLRTTHNQKDWFVPVNVALEGLTPAALAPAD